MEKRTEDKFAGVLVKAKNTNRVFLMLRNQYAIHPLTWGLISGGINEGEDTLEGLKREIYEECQIDPNIIEFSIIHDENERNGKFYYYEGLTDNEFIPTLDHENLDYMWCDLNNLPEPLYPNLINKIEELLKK